MPTIERRVDTLEERIDILTERVDELKFRADTFEGHILRVEVAIDRGLTAVREAIGTPPNPANDWAGNGLTLTICKLGARHEADRLEALAYRADREQKEAIAAKTLADAVVAREQRLATIGKFVLGVSAISGTAFAILKGIGVIK